MVRAMYAPHHAAEKLRIFYTFILQDCLGMNHIMAMDVVLMPAHIFYIVHSVLACSEALLKPWNCCGCMSTCIQKNVDSSPEFLGWVKYCSTFYYVRACAPYYVLQLFR